MRVLFTSVPAISRMRLLLGLAHELASRGAEVSFAVTSELAAVLPSNVAPFFGPATVAALRRRSERETPGFAGLPPDRQAFEMFSWTWARTVRGYLDDIKDEGFDLLVHEEGDHAAPLAATALGLPRVCVEWPCPPRGPELVQAVDERIEEVAKEFGLGAIPPADLAVTTSPKDFRPDNHHSVAGVARVHMRLITIDKVARSVDGLGGLPYGRTVHATFGTVPASYHPPNLFQLVDRALVDEPLNLVMTAGDLFDETNVTSRSGLRLARHIPHSDLLPMCSAVICHGGVSTALEALARGIPLIVLPIGGASQRRIAQGCAHTGAGLAFDIRRLTTTRLREGVTRVLDEPHFGENARRIARDINTMPDVSAVAGELIARFGP